MSFGPCMCGDTQCPSCGPAQGNYRCPICRVWADDGCEHIGDDGNVVPEFQAQADAIAQAENEADNQLAQDLIDEEALVDAWRRQELPK